MEAAKIKVRQERTLSAFDRMIDGSGFSWSDLDALSNWLCGKEWTHFLTLTTKYEMTPNAARKIMDKWGHHVSTVLGPGFECFWVAEKHGNKKKQGVHVHAVVKVPETWQWKGKGDFSPMPGQCPGLGKRYWAWMIMLDAARFCAGGEAWKNKRGEFGKWHRVKIDEYQGSEGVKYCMKYLTKGFRDWDYYSNLKER
jgi:hypothetical protein